MSRDGPAAVDTNQGYDMNIDLKLYHRAMKAAAKEGYDPYNTVPVQAKHWKRLFALDAGRKAAEAARLQEEWEARRAERMSRTVGWVKG